MNPATARKQKCPTIRRIPPPREPAQPAPPRPSDNNAHPEESQQRATLVPAPT
jgi:hypothetical protein